MITFRPLLAHPRPQARVSTQMSKAKKRGRGAQGAPAAELDPEVTGTVPKTQPGEGLDSALGDWDGSWTASLLGHLFASHDEYLLGFKASSDNQVAKWSKVAELMQQRAPDAPM